MTYRADTALVETGLPQLVDKRILVVDDHAANVALLRAILDRAGANNVHTTTDPFHAIQLFRDLVPDLVLLDLHMPGLDGVEVMGELRRLTPSNDLVPIIVLTADSTPGAREHVLAAGANDFLTKPFDRTEVVLRSRNLLHMRTLHAALRNHNSELVAEVELRRASEAHERAEEARIRSTIEDVLDSDAPRMVFQPIAEIANGSVVGYEALARFDTDPPRSPDKWFADAAAVDLGIDLELAAVSGALEQLESVPADQFLTVNVSPATATDPRCEQLLDGYPGDRVVVEITEHARIDDYGPLLDALARMRAGGVRLAVDDAGSGWASLSHILKLQPDIIKLDITLTRDIGIDPIKRALGASLVSFGEDIGSTLIAEGIETAQEQEALDELGVSWGQGYYIARPGELAPAPV